MHPRHARHQLRARKNHATAPENIVNKVQHHENPMRVSAIANPDKLQRSMRIRHPQLSDDSQHSHQSDLERQAASPPDGKGDAPAVGVGGGNDGFVDPPKKRRELSV